MVLVTDATMAYISPFLRSLPEPRSKEVITSIEELKLWRETQPHLPPISDDYFHLFLHSCYGDLEVTKKTIEAYFTVRTHAPDLFSQKDPLLPEIQNVLDIANLLALPRLTPEGYRVLLYRLTDYDASKLHFVTILKVFFMFNDMILSEDGLAAGYIVIFDMQGVHLGHLAKVSLGAIRKFMIYIQDAHPARLKGVHVINTVGFIDKILALIKPFMKSELIQLLHLHGPVESLSKFLPLELLPENYGGQADKAEELHDKYRRLLETSYRSWLLEEESLRVDEGKRPLKQSWWRMFWGSAT